MTSSNNLNDRSNTDIKFAIGACTLGSIIVAISDRGICAISLGDEPDILVSQLQKRFPHAELIVSDSPLEQLIEKVVDLVETPALGLVLPLDVRGTVFQKCVGKALQDIPAGSTVSQLYRSCPSYWSSQVASGCCRSLCGQYVGSSDSLPSYSEK